MKHDENHLFQGNLRSVGSNLNQMFGQLERLVGSFFLAADLGGRNAPGDGAAREAQLPFKVHQAFQAHVTTGVVTPGG